MTDAGVPISTLATAPTSLTNFNPKNVYQAPVVAGQFRELFPSFGESKRLAQGLINERPTTQSIVDMIRGVPANANLGLQAMQSNVVGAPPSLNNVLSMIGK